MRAADGHSPVGSGRGLHGMRERAAAYGGKLDAGPGADGGWRVHLRLRRRTPQVAGAMTTRVLLADDQELMRMGFRMVIDSQPDLAIVGEAANGRRGGRGDASAARRTSC